MISKIITIGVYGFDEAAFFRALKKAGVDTFCDIRWRRGLRGTQYAFANSGRLQQRLSALGVRYLHLPDLAPSPALRARQDAADKTARLPKRQRTRLSPEFIAGYQQERLQHFQSADFVQRLGPEAAIIALFCVEGEAAACHRSLVAERLAKDLGVEVIDLKCR
jgi:uncharacterized protein (DUF488 family)